MGKGGEIYKELKDTKEDKPVNRDRKGRSPDLIDQRNEQIAHRFVYWLKRHPQYRYDAHLTQLAKEFNLSVVTVGEIIQKMPDSIKQIKKDFPPAKELKERWHWMVWVGVD
jgi:hypothetical protein